MFSSSHGLTDGKPGSPLGPRLTYFGSINVLMLRVGSKEPAFHLLFFGSFLPFSPQKVNNKEFKNFLLYNTHR